MGAVFSSCAERKPAKLQPVWDSDDDRDMDYATITWTTLDATVHPVVYRNKDGSYSILNGKAINNLKVELLKAVT